MGQTLGVVWGTGHGAEDPALRMLPNIWKQGRGKPTASWGNGQGIRRGASACPRVTLLRVLR